MNKRRQVNPLPHMRERHILRTYFFGVLGVLVGLVSLIFFFGILEALK